MLVLRVKKILKEKGKTKYWLRKRMFQQSGISYQNFNNIVENRTKGIQFRNLELISDILDCPVGELFERVSDDITSKENLQS